MIRFSISKIRIIFVGTVMLVAGRPAHSGNNEMTGFHYQTCDAKKCYAVKAAKAWLSQSNGAFVASGLPSQKNGAVFQILVAGKVTREFTGDEISSQPEINSITIESEESVVMMDTETFDIEVIPKLKFKSGVAP